MASFPVDEGLGDMLRAGIAAARSGQRERARDLLMQVVEQDEGNLQAWLWLSGVVDSLDDQEVCLENVLALDPGHQAARKGLAWVRQQLKDRPPPPPESTPPPAPPTQGEPEIRIPASLTEPQSKPPHTEAAHIKPSASAAAVLGEEYIRRHTPQDTELAPARIDNEFDNEYLCPYCAVQTRHDDNRCSACRGKLWFKIHTQQKRSCWYWLVFVTQLVNTIGYAFLFAGVMILILEEAKLGRGLLSPQAPMYSELPAQAAKTLSIGLFSFVVTLLAALFIYSLVVLVGLYLRWMAILYLYLASAAVWVGLAFVSLFLAIGGEVDWFTTVGRMLTAAWALFLAFMLGKDFSFEKRRIFLRIDKGATTAVALLDSGRQYAKSNMWAKAAIHFRSAASIMPNEIEPQLMLVATYFNLKRYDLAEKALANAKRIRPGHPQVEKLTALLNSRRAVAKGTSA
jgi:tetratricopeptide (TPR) repeat protein